MSGWGIAETAPVIEKIKAESADYLRGLNSCGDITWSVYDKAFDFYMELISRAYEQGKKDAEPHWISCSERLPECEQEVLICTEKKLVGRDAYIDPIITPAMYEDGTMRENDSSWRWEDMDWAGWDDEEDCGIIPEGWWENRHFNQDEVYNNPVDQKVIAWMPLPEPWRGDAE